MSYTLDLNAPPVKSPKRSSQISGAGGAVSNWAPLSRLKNSFSNSAMSINTTTSGNGVGGVSGGLKNKLGTPYNSSSRQDFSGSNSEFTANKELHGLSTHSDITKDDSPDHAPLVSSSTSGSSNQNNSNVAASLNDTIVSNELEGAITECTINSDGNIEEEDDDDPNSTMQFESGRDLNEELWFHGVLPRGKHAPKYFIPYKT